MENNLKFVKYHQPCPSCGSSDALSLNEDGSGKCFSCHKFFPSIDKQSTFKSSQVKTSMKETIKELNAHGGVFAKLTDRNIAKETAEKYGVKVVYDSNGTLAQHIYPLYINNELTSNKIDTSGIRNFLLMYRLMVLDFLVNSYSKREVSILP